jgi:nucleotide-binding universal stress UspA family protein
MPEAGMIAWPMDEYDTLMDGSKESLHQLKKELEDTIQTDQFSPHITCISEDGLLTDVVNQIVGKQKIDLIVMATHGQDGLSGLIIGDHSHIMINGSNTPLLLVPPSALISDIKKIAFATDFKHPLGDLDHIYALIDLARLFNAEILLTHVYDDADTDHVFQKQIKLFLSELSNKANYPNIYYRIVKNRSTETGLSWLCRHGQIDMLAMVHRPHNFFDNLIRGSHTKKMASDINVPLLVYQGL